MTGKSCKISSLRLRYMVSMQPVYNVLLVPPLRPVDLVLDTRKVLRIAAHVVHPVLDEQAECPRSESRLRITLDNVQCGAVDATTEFAGLGDDGIDALVEWVVKRWQGRLAACEVRVRGQVKDILDKTGHGFLSDPEEHVLAVFDEEETVSFQSFRGEVERWRHDDAGFSDRACFCWHVVERIEAGMDEGNEGLGGESGKEILGVCAEIRRGCGALAQSNVLDKTTAEEWEESQVCGDRKLRGCSCRACDLILVDREHVAEAVGDDIAGIVQGRAREALFNSLVGKVRCNGDLVCRGVELGNGVGSRHGLGDDANATLAVAGSV